MGERRSRFPRRALALGLVTTLLLIGLATWISTLLYGDVVKLVPSIVHHRQLASSLVALDQAATMSARVAVLSGDPGWVKRYDEEQAAFDSALAEATSANGGLDGPDAARWHVADARLDEFVADAFHLLDDGRPEQARSIIFSDEFELERAVYDDAVEAAMRSVLSRIDSSIVTHRESARRAMFMLGVCGLALVLVWLRIAALIRRYTDEIASGERALVESHRLLEDRVAARTSELRFANERLHHEMKSRAAVEVDLRHAQKLSSIGQLAAGVAHEINTPAQYVSESADFLRRNCEPIVLALRSAGNVELAADVPSALDDVVEGTARITTIVRSMRAFSHPSNGAKTPVPLRAAIETTVAVARNEWKDVAEVVVDVDDALPAVPALRDELNQVILNMLVNASHAIDDRYRGAQRGSIRIKARAAGGNAELSIADDGNGIPSEVRQHIFEPFFTTKPVGKGTGQGLAIAWAVVVEKHGGSIAVDSDLGVGTTFTIRLPLTA